jgi:hypothetical protein
MADPFHSIQPSFSGGEFSPEMYSRVDLAKYATGLKTARNGFVHPQGGFSNRSGFRFVAKAKYSDKKCRLIPFEFSDTQSYMLEFGHLYVRFYVNGGQILFGGLPYEIATPYTESDLPLIKYVQSADTVYLAHPGHAPQTLVRHADTNWVLSDFPFVNGPFMQENTGPITNSFGQIFIGPDAGKWEILASAPLFDPLQVGARWRIDYDLPAQSWAASFAAPGTGNIIATSGDFNISTTGTWTGTFWIEKSTDGVHWTAVSQSFVSHNDFNVNTNGNAGEACQLRVNVSVLSAGTLNITLSAQAFNYSVILKIKTFVNSTQVFTDPAPQPIGLASGLGALVTTWFEGAWSSLRGWPSAVTFYQDRLGWASTPAQPQAAWWSKTGNYVDYGISSPLVDSDAISVNMPTRKLNAVQHLLPMTVVLALTSSGEISIGPGGNGDFTPTSIDLRPQTYHGSAGVPPVIVGNQAIFVQARSTIVRNISYQYFTNIFIGDNLSLISNHLFTNYSLVDMTYCESPDSLIFAVRSDGVLLCFTYLPEQQVMAWTHWDTAGSFESCAVIPATSYDELWVVVNRANGRFIERLAQRMPTFDTKDQFHVDCGIDYSGAPTTGISGLDHLNGQPVMVLADGNVQGPFTVVAGSITLTVAASLAHIGLAYTSDLETLNIERAGQDGTSQDRRTRVTAVTMRFYNSLGGYIGPSASKLHPIIPSPPSSLGSYRPLFTGDVPKISITPDWQSNGRIFFRQTDPLPFTLTGVFPANESGNL